MRGLALEKVRSKDPYILKAREHMYIKKSRHIQEWVEEGT